MSSSYSKILRPWLAGAFAVAAGHQVALSCFWWSGWTAREPFSLQATAPLGVPALLSLMFWGGLWGVLLGALLRWTRPGSYWVAASVFGALAPTLVAGLVVAPLRGLPMAGGGEPREILAGLATNAAWGLVTAALLRLETRCSQS